MAAASAQIASARDRVVYEAKVPSDIDISQSLSPLDISAIAHDAGILPHEVCIWMCSTAGEVRALTGCWYWWAVATSLIRHVHAAPAA